MSADTPPSGLTRLDRLVLATTSMWQLSAINVHLFDSRFPPHPGDGREATTARLFELVAHILDAGPAEQAWLRVGDDDPWQAGEAARSVVAGLADQDWSGPGRPPDLRLFVDAARLRHLVSVEPGPVWVIIDLRFEHWRGEERLAAHYGDREEPPRQLRCLVAVSIWSAPPHSSHLRPPGELGVGPAIYAADEETLHRHFRQVARETERLFTRHGLGQIKLYLSDRDYMTETEYTLPTFWVMIPAEGPVDPADYVGTPEWRGWTSRFSQRLLAVADPRDSTVTHSVVNGSLAVLRRVVPAAEGIDVPTYLIAPGRGSDGLADPAVTEEVVTGLVRDLAAIEAQAANLVQDRERDLEIWSNHLKVYNTVVERGAFLWDALSTHLMIQWGAWFERAHNAVDMIHQVLQQAVADLRHIGTLTAEATARVEESASDLKEKYDRLIAERQAPGDRGEPPLRTALIETSLFGRVVRLGAETQGRAERVKNAYDDLLRAISGAFDERRVRELDGTQRASFLLGFFAALIGLVSVIDAVVKIIPGDASDSPINIWLDAGYQQTWVDDVAAGLSLLIGLTVVGLSVYLLFNVTRIGKLGSSRFRRIYQGGRRLVGLWRVLSHTSTDHQKNLARDTTDEDWSAAWDTRDREAAEQVARHWDAATRLKPVDRDDDFRKDINTLSVLIERWGTHSLILTERVRVMHWFDLPNLTCLYHVCTEIKGSFLTYSDVPPVNMVADIDFLLSMGRLGFNRREAMAISAWLREKRPASATAALKLVGELGLKVGMGAGQRSATLDAIGYAAGSAQGGGGEGDAEADEDRPGAGGQAAGEAAPTAELGGEPRAADDQPGQVDG